MSSQIPIVIVQPHLEFGGAERQTVLAANALADDGVDCKVVLHEARGGLLRELTGDVQVHSLNLENHLATPIVALRLRRLLDTFEPAYVIVKLWSSILACAMIDQTSKHVFNYCEDLDPSDHADYIRLGRIKQRLIGRIFRTRQHLTANTRQVATSMATLYRLQNIPDVVPSTVDTSLVQQLALKGSKSIRREDSANILTVGSLISRKGLLESLEVLGNTNIPIAWHVVGEGPLRPQLIKDARKYSNLELVMHGGHANPYPYMAQADLVLHNPLSEAFGIVILEALALGTPVVAAAAIGPTEIQQVLGKNEDLLRLYDIGDRLAMRRSVIQCIETSVGVNHAEAGPRYISAYSLAASVQMWKDRARSVATS